MKILLKEPKNIIKYNKNSPRRLKLTDKSLPSFFDFFKGWLAGPGPPSPAISYLLDSSLRPPNSQLTSTTLNPQQSVSPISCRKPVHQLGDEVELSPGHVLHQVRTLHYHVIKSCGGCELAECKLGLHLTCNLSIRYMCFRCAYS
jgi:hypothetical protein